MFEEDMPFLETNSPTNRTLSLTSTEQTRGSGYSAENTTHMVQFDELHQNSPKARSFDIRLLPERSYISPPLSHPIEFVNILFPRTEELFTNMMMQPR